jgi:RNA polymerase-binding protein DksA
MTKAERERYRSQLKELARRMNGDVDTPREEAMQAQGGEASGNLSNAPMHLADLGTENFQQELSLSLLEGKTGLLTDVSDALQRLDDSTFGVCENCQQPISKERLDALPFTRHCIDCASRLDHDDAVRV